MGELTFGILGPLEVRDGRGLVPISSPKHRVLLVALVADANRVVSTARLAEAIWGERQPANPRRAVQLCVTRLRTALPGAPLIMTSVDGYRIEVAANRIDLHRFRRLVRAAGEAADPGRESALLRAALRLWRDDPLAGVPSDLLHETVAPSLVEERLVALEQRFDADLRLGRHHEVIGALSAAVAGHPLRERFREQLMTALHRGGRRADALAVYHAGRRLLVEELGIGPGERMRQLHQSVLGYTPGAGTPSVPRQLPRETTAFTGRVAELTRLAELATEPDGPAGTVVLSGTAGSGKTALAVRWGRLAAELFPDGQLWVDLRGHDTRPPVAAAAALATLLRSLGVDDPPPDAGSRIGLYRSIMDGRRMLVVLDDARNSAQVWPILPGAAGSTVLVTSRVRLTGLLAAGARAVPVGLLPAADAEELLRRRLGAARVTAEPGAVARIVERCARLPLALALAVGRAVGCPALSLAALAEQLRRPLSTLSDVDMDLRATFALSYRTLSPPAAHLFRALARPSGSWCPPAPGPVLDELIQAHLVAEPSPGRYEMHDLLRAYATELSTSYRVPVPACAVR